MIQPKDQVISLLKKKIPFITGFTGIFNIAINNIKCKLCIKLKIYDYLTSAILERQSTNFNDKIRIQYVRVFKVIFLFNITKRSASHVILQLRYTTLSQDEIL